MDIVDGKDYVSEIKQMIDEYTRDLGRDLTFQSLQDELDDPLKQYGGDAGKVLVAVEDGCVMGMVAYHRHSSRCCEMKRFYVKPRYRGRGIGKKLVAAIINFAELEGYSTMVLDTLEPMEAAINLYQRFGFEECSPYYDNPFFDVIYMQKNLEEEASTD